MARKRRKGRSLRNNRGEGTRSFIALSLIVICLFLTLNNLEVNMLQQSLRHDHFINHQDTITMDLDNECEPHTHIIRGVIPY